MAQVIRIGPRGQAYLRTILKVSALAAMYEYIASTASLLRRCVIVSLACGCKASIGGNAAP
jgi:hypothetical protein